MRDERHELCVIGAGTAGFAAAEAARSEGRDVVLVVGEDELGGTCILRGCMPAKTLLAAAESEGEIERARDVGVEAGPIRVDLPAIVRRKRALVEYFAADRAHELASYPLVRGDARFVAPDTVAAGIDGDRARGIVVDEMLRSRSNPRAFAAGDVLGRRQMVHSAAYGGRLAAHNAFASEPIAAQWDRWEPHAVYTQPQVAIAGMTERVCRSRGIDVRVATLPASEVGKALVSGESEGFVKMLARRGDGRVLGIALVTDDAIDLAGEAIALIDRRATAREIAEMPHLHPTMSELLARVAEKLTA